MTGVSSFSRFILAIVLTLFLISCTKNNKDQDSIMNFPLSGEISTLDPANSYDAVSLAVTYQGYEQLFEYQYLLRPYKIIPLLAESMPKVENDGTKYTIKIISTKEIRKENYPNAFGNPRHRALCFVRCWRRRPLAASSWSGGKDWI